MRLGGTEPGAVATGSNTQRAEFPAIVEGTILEKLEHFS
jgi:hypothetical protein